MDEQNPYTAPSAEILAPHSAGSDVEYDRREHLNTESSIKAIGFLHGLGGIACFIALNSYVHSDDPDRALMLGLLGFFGVMAVISAVGCIKLKAWLRLPAGLTSGIGLLNFPIGTLLNVYFLSVIFGAKGRRVLSPDYKAVIAATPHIKQKTSMVAKVLLGILLVVLIFVVAAVIMSES